MTVKISDAINDGIAFGLFTGIAMSCVMIPILIMGLTAQYYEVKFKQMYLHEDNGIELKQINKDKYKDKDIKI